MGTRTKNQIVLKKTKVRWLLFKIFEHESFIRSTNVALAGNVRCYISVAEKHKTIFRLMTENNKYKQIIEFNPITAIEYSSCYK